MAFRSAFVLVVIGCGSVVSAADLSRVKVSLGADSQGVLEAVTALTNHLALVCGSAVGTDGVEFVLGAPPPGVLPAARDESQIRVQGGKVYLWGDDSELDGSAVRKGTLMAVSGFLENRMGVRWVWPGKDGMVFKARRDVDLPEGWSWRYVPPFGLQDFRTYGAWRLMRRADMTPDEFRCTHVDATNIWRDCEMWTHLLRLQTRNIFPYRHAFTDWQRKYLKTHPEYLALTGKTQRGMRPSQAQWVKLCVSNPKVVDRIIADWRTDGAPEYINICPNDYNRGFCICSNCRKLDVVPYRGGAEGNLTDRYVNFWNRIVEKAVAIRPDVKAVTYVYSLYKAPPLREKIAYPDNIIFGMVPLLTDDLAAQIAGWKSAGMKHFFLRPNWLCYRAATMRGLERVLYDSFKTAANADALGFDFDNDVHAPQINLERYVIGRLLGCPDMSFGAICEEYYSAYGAAASAVREWHECLRTRSETVLERMCEMARGDVPKADDSQYSDILACAVPVDEMARHEQRLCEVRRQVAAMLATVELKRLDALILRLAHDQLTSRFMQAKGGERSLKEIGAELLSFRLRHRHALNCNWNYVFADDFSERALWEKFHGKGEK